MIKTAISGASGKMGKMLIEAIMNHPEFELVAALDHAGSSSIGQDAVAFLGKESNVKITADTACIKVSGAQVLIDFTRPEGTVGYLKVCGKDKIAMVIGTTGFSAEQKNLIDKTAKVIPIAFAPNMSTGVNVTFKLLAEAAKLMPDYDCEIVEMHHNRKVDAPSGTAVEMGRVIAEARGQKLEDVAEWTRHGHTGPRVKGSIGFAVLRGGDVVGDHRVIFAGKGERIEIAHLSASREGYAQGALKAAAFLIGKHNGLYNMADVLGLKDN
ncbi:4-hydroxy-tetrahydrodipicolinate reductase [Turicimonas muris]|uniref:4-hydroxy-tetrahydrodipicolinate reductase n=1 Tax=Turicimonas muris TaxID=1796652 RepID=UPI00402A983D